MRRCLLAVGLAACSDYGVNKAVPAHDGDVDCLAEAPEPWAVEVDDTCTFAPLPGSWTPAVEWQWSASTLAPGYDDVMMTPVVGDLDGDSVPEIVFTAYAANSYGSPGALIVLAGDGSAEKAAWTTIGGYTPNGSAGVALGDLDGDGTPEIVTITTDNRVIVVEPDGALKWVSDAFTGSDFNQYAYPSIADMDGNGHAEVVVGRVILDDRGKTRGIGAYGMGGPYGISVVVDLEGDGEQEVVVGNAVYSRDGTAKWTSSLPDGWPAVADFDNDGMGEVATVYGGSVWLTDTFGALLWGPSTLPGGGGGPPTIADFDGDGSPEIGVAGASSYAVFDTNGALLWSQPTTDASSSMTGSSVFDFEGDGKSEVIYADELVLWGYDGASGAAILAESGHSSWTLFEYPTVADVDGDGEAEIVLASNDSINAGWQGITVIGDASASWAPVAPVWNQHGYYITNIEDDLSVPTSPRMSWDGGNNSFRAAGSRDGIGNPAPDLEAHIESMCGPCDVATTDVIVYVENHGTADVTEDIPVALYALATDGTETLLTHGELPGGVVSGASSAPIAMVLASGDVLGAAAIVVRVDDDGAGGSVAGECDETNNAGEIEVAACE